MGDPAISAALQEGVEITAALIGETVEIEGPVLSAVDPTQPSKNRLLRAPLVEVQAIIEEVADSLVDGELIKSGDRIMTVPASDPNASLVKSGSKAILGANSPDYEGRPYLIVRVSTIRISGGDVSYRAVLR